MRSERKLLGHYAVRERASPFSRALPVPPVVSLGYRKSVVQVWSWSSSFFEFYCIFVRFFRCHVFVHRCIEALATFNYVVIPGLLECVH